MQLFGGRFNFIAHEKPRANFDGILQAMLTVFQVGEKSHLLTQLNMVP
ncbi:unnamed protein product [Schistosoma curassoni]|uniref:Transposase n=1 Tax=Schistosoma curassoni TaxID=6186 RepID=A0A183JT46_9TREM|nr:unnamed protein product [Schistosoma curassoni]